MSPVPSVGKGCSACLFGAPSRNAAAVVVSVGDISIDGFELNNRVAENSRRIKKKETMMVFSHNSYLNVLDLGTLWRQ